MSDCDGLGACGGARGAGIEWRCRRLLIEAEKEGNRGVMAWIEISPAYRRRDGRGRDLGKKGRKVERGVSVVTLTGGVGLSAGRGA